MWRIFCSLKSSRPEHPTPWPSCKSLNLDKALRRTSTGWQRALTTGYDSTPHRVKENTRSAASFAAKPRSDIAIGQRVFHQKFGYGRIVAVDGNKLDIEFEKAGPKKVLDSFVEKA